jgi:hypothetical protein
MEVAGKVLSLLGVTVFLMFVVAMADPELPRFWPGEVNVTTQDRSARLVVHIENNAPVPHKGAAFTGYGCDTSRCYDKSRNPDASPLKKGDECIIKTRGVATLTLVGYGWSMARVRYSTINDTSDAVFPDDECPTGAEFWVPWVYYNLDAR